MNNPPTAGSRWCDRCHQYVLYGERHSCNDRRRASSTDYGPDIRRIAAALERIANALEANDD